MKTTLLTSTDRQQSNADLVLKAQQGDPNAFADLYEAHKSKVYSICLRMTSNPSEAEDLAQDVFLHVFRKIGTFRRDSAFSTWLYRVTVNTVLMHFRRKNVHPISIDEPVPHNSGARAREYGKVDGELHGTVDRIAVARAMNELPAGYRTVFLLHEVNGYEHHDIARLLHCSVGTSKSQLHKAKASIRKLLGFERKRSPKIKRAPATLPAKAQAADWSFAA